MEAKQLTTETTYTRIGVVDVHSGRTTVTMMDREAVKRIKELERQLKQLQERNEELERRAKAAESRLLHARIVGSAA